MTHELIDKLRILGSTNTQTRRLGYVVQICKMLASNPAPMAVLQKRIEDWAEEHNSALRHYISDKGRLSSSPRSYGSKRYVQLAEGLGLITEVLGYLRPTITGQVLLELSDESREDNPFQLGPRTALLLFYQLLLLDADYLLPTLQLTQHCHKQDQLLENYQDTLSSRLKTMEIEVKTSLLRSEVYARLQAITRWTMPITYSEHIALPRLHWLIDLKLLDWNSFEALRMFEPSTAGASLINQSPALDGHIFINRNWCQNIFFSVWAQAFSFEHTSWHSLSENSQALLIGEYVELGFQLFSTELHHRISAYQLVLFIILKLLFEEKTLAGFEDIKQALNKFSKSGNIRWNFLWSAIDDDGHLILLHR
jgi:hypothetical protein